MSYSDGVAFVIVEGGQAPSRPEALLARFRRGIVLDHIVRAQAVPELTHIILCTDDRDLAAQAQKLGAHVDWDDPSQSAPGVPFHFGRRLQQAIDRYGLRRVCVLGGGAGPLMRRDELAGLAKELLACDRTVLANNIYSADIVAFTPADALLTIDPPAKDNGLATALKSGAGLRAERLPRSLGLHFDVDTPTDMMVLAVHPSIGTHAKAVVDALSLDLSRITTAKRILQNSKADLFLFGRIGAPLFSFLDEATACRIRLLSEERGMKSLGRDERDEVVSLLGYLWEEAGPNRLFSYLASICSAALLDTRVLFAHRKYRLTSADRFYSDLGESGSIEHPEVRRFTEEAFRCSVPILLGGHSLVTGGIWALVDAIQREEVWTVDPAATLPAPS